MKLSIIASLLFLNVVTAYAQLNTFSEGDVISAEQMNENFQYLEQQFRGARAKTVDCDDGETINEAIEKGYTNITVSGTCTENLLYTVWRDNANEDRLPNNTLAPRYLKISGASIDSKIMDASANTESTISVNSGTTLFLQNITISGGVYGVAAVRNSNLLLSGVKIENFTARGIRVSDSSYLGIDIGGVTIVGSGTGSGLVVETGSSAWFNTATISGVETGIEAIFGSTILTGGYIISASVNGIMLNNSRFMQYGGTGDIPADGWTGKITGTSDVAVLVYQGVFDVWDPGALELHDLIGGRGIDLRQSKASINNLKLLNFNNTGSGWNPAIHIGNGSSVNFHNAEISGSTDGQLINIEDGATVSFEKLTLTGESTENDLIGIRRNSHMNFRNSTISGTATNSLISISDSSSAQVRDSSFTLSADVTAIGLTSSSNLRLENSSITGDGNKTLVSIHHGSYGEIRDTTLIGGTQNVIDVDQSRLSLRDSSISNKGGDSLLFIHQGSSGIVRDSSLTSASEIGIDVDSGELNFRNSQLAASDRGMRLYQNTFAAIWDGSSVSSTVGRAIELSKGSGLRVRSGVSILSSQATALKIEQASWASIDNGEQITISKENGGPDIEVSSMSYLNVEGSHQIEQVDCSRKSYAEVVEGAVVNLGSDCL